MSQGHLGAAEGGSAVAGQAEAELASVLPRPAEEITWPVTAGDGDSHPCADFFALDEVG